MPVRPKSKLSGRKPVRGGGGGAHKPKPGQVRGDSGGSDDGSSKGSGSKKRVERAANPAVIAEPTAPSGPAEPRFYATGFVDDEWQDAGVRGRVFVCGLPGSGKSQLLVDRVRGGRRVVVYNPVNAKTLLALQSEGFVPVSQPEQLKQGLIAAWGQDFRFIYTPTGGVERDHFEAVNKMVAACGRMIYAVDEVDKNQEPGWCPPNFSGLCNYGRHYETALIGTARRPAQVSKDFTFCLSEIVAFNISEPGQLQYFSQKCGESAARMLPKLGKYEYLRWQSDGRIVTGKGWKK